MTEIIPYRSPFSHEPSFKAVEFSVPSVTVNELASAMGRYSIFSALMDHQQTQGLQPEDQVWSGINAKSLVVRRTLFSDINPTADSARLNTNFNATQLEHWRSVLGEVKYSPFTYIYKGLLRGDNEYPAIVGFDRSKLVAAYNHNENIDWMPVEGETVESSLRSIYYFDGLFPKVDLDSSTGFDIPAHLVPEDHASLADMINFINETNTGFQYNKVRTLWAEANYPERVASLLQSWAFTLRDHFYDNPKSSVLDYKQRRGFSQAGLDLLFSHDPDLLHEMVEAFNNSFFGSHMYRFEINQAELTILGKKIYHESDS